MEIGGNIMAKSGFSRLKSQDILSAHINGLASAIDNIEDVLSMQTASVEDYELYAISDIDEDEYNYRIYEGNIRGWQTTPTPTVKVDGKIADPSTYEIQPAFGVVVFHEQQMRTSTVTVSCTYVKAGSTKVNDIAQKAEDALSQAQKNANDISTLDSDMTQVKSDIEELKSIGGGIGGGNAGGGTTETVDIAIDGYMAGGGELTDGKLIIPKGDTWITHTTSESPALSSAVAVGANTIDAFPIYVSQRIIVDKIKVECAKVNQSGAKSLFGIYSCANGLPHRRLAQTATLADTVGTMEAPFRDGNLRLEAGIYWIARFCNAGSQYNGLTNANAIPLELPSDMATNGSGTAHGIRATYGNDATLPLEFPMGSAQALARTSYTCPWIHITKSYV